MGEAVQDESEFRQLVLDRFEDLPPQQQAIAAYLIDHVREVPFLSVPELAVRTGASEATIVRFAQRIGYSGFAELKMVLLELVRGQLARGGGEPSAPVEGDVFAAVATVEQGNLERAMAEMDLRRFRAAAAAIFKADHLFTFGLGISACLADLAAYLFAQIGLRATAVGTRTSSPQEALVPLRPSDLLFAFSFPPYSRGTLRLLQGAVEKGLTTVAVTDRLTAPAAGLARHALVVPSHNMMFTNAVAGVTVLLNALVTEVAVRHQGEAVEALSQINRILTQEEDLIHGQR